jgi:hypothetical protein
MDQNEIPDDPRYLGVPSGASKMIFEPMEHSMQTLLLSRVKISTISSKQTETSFDLSLINWEYHWLCLKKFMSLWYV